MAMTTGLGETEFGGWGGGGDLWGEPFQKPLIDVRVRQTTTTMCSLNEADSFLLSYHLYEHKCKDKSTSANMKLNRDFSKRIHLLIRRG